MSAVSMHNGWLILRALRSDSRECPRRTGVRCVDAVDEDEDVVKGLGGGGAKSFIICACASTNVVVTGASASAVIPDHL